MCVSKVGKTVSRGFVSFIGTDYAENHYTHTIINIKLQRLNDEQI